LIDELKDPYSAKKQIIGSLPKLAKAVTSPDLKQALLLVTSTKPKDKFPVWNKSANFWERELPENRALE
jgi:hypothetical protein